MLRQFRHTKIVVTLGPSTERPEQLRALIDAGVDVMRLNMAHATSEWVASTVAAIREVSRQASRHVAVMMDVKGPEIRTGPLPRSVELEPGDEIELFTETPRDGFKGVSVSVNYRDLPADVEVGATILIDSGLLRLEIIGKDATHVRCRVLTRGMLGSRRHINLPGVEVNLPALTEKDRLDVLTGVEVGIDFFALSFVRRPDDVRKLREMLEAAGSTARIIAKIEDQSGVRNLEAIVQEADAVMVARGDLGIEIEYHVLPIVQRRIVDICLAAGKPVIIATHLLESMTNAPMPTRAEISDVSNAVRERADAVMLSGETTTGTYPLECVDVLKNIIVSTEPDDTRGLNESIVLVDPKAKMLRSAAMLAQQLGDSGIVVFTRSGFLAYTLAALRAGGVPIYAFTDDEALFRQMLLPWGVEPFLMAFSDDPEDTIQQALQYLERREWCRSGAWLVVITNVLAHGRVVDTLQLRRVGEEPV